MGLRDIGDTLPPGFRFYPSDEELVCHYLYNKINNQQLLRGTLVEIDLHVCEPWQLPDVAKLNSNEWYFFSFRDRKYATGFRTNRATTSGYWKATGKDRSVVDPKSRAVVGMRKTLVFYKNRAPNGIKTGYIMHEFRLENPHVPPKEDWVLCRVFHKSRGENNNNLMSPHNFYDSKAAATSPNLASSPTNNPYAHQNTFFLHSQNPSTSLGLSALVDPLYVHLSHDHHMNEPHNKMMDTTTTTTKCDDDYGFLFDFDASNNGVSASLGDMVFDHDDSNSVFI